MVEDGELDVELPETGRIRRTAMRIKLDLLFFAQLGTIKPEHHEKLVCILGTVESYNKSYKRRPGRRRKAAKRPRHQEEFFDEELPKRSANIDRR